MKSKEIIRIILFVFCIDILLVGFNINQKSCNLMKNINDSLNGQITESGITIEFLWEKNIDNLFSDLLKNLEGASYNHEKLLKRDKGYYVEIEKNSMHGYIESSEYENYNIVKISIINKDDKNEFEKIQYILKNTLCVNNTKCYEYLKAKIPYENIESANEKVVRNLKKLSALNINTVDIQNGYSTTAYTGLNKNKIYNNGRYIDFNYAICKYSSGVYLIIGTPEITVTY